MAIHPIPDAFHRRFAGTRLSESPGFAVAQELQYLLALAGCARLIGRKTAYRQFQGPGRSERKPGQRREDLGRRQQMRRRLCILQQALEFFRANCRFHLFATADA